MISRWLVLPDHLALLPLRSGIRKKRKRSALGYNLAAKYFDEFCRIELLYCWIRDRGDTGEDLSWSIGSVHAKVYLRTALKFPDSSNCSSALLRATRPKQHYHCNWPHWELTRCLYLLDDVLFICERNYSWKTLLNIFYCWSL